MISQPMKGKTKELIKEERKVLVQEFEDRGYEVLDTIFDEAPKNVDEAIWFLSKSIEYLAQADVIFFMKGWEKARGCKIENKICQDYGKQTMYDIYEKGAKDE